MVSINRFFNGVNPSTVMNRISEMGVVGRGWRL